MSFSSTAIATGIAGLTITGVTVKDITTIPDSVENRMCPILFPSPGGWMANGNGNGPSTFGTPSTRYWEFERTYQYVYLHAEVGTGRGIKDFYSAMAGKADAILTALTLLDITDVDVVGITVSDFGVLKDPSEQHQFFGFTLNVTLRERLNN